MRPIGRRVPLRPGAFRAVPIAGASLFVPHRGTMTSCAASSYLFTSESVSEGHPDKVCDRISDDVVDAYPRPPMPGSPRRLRDARHHQPRRHRRRGARARARSRRTRVDRARPRGHQGYRLRAGRLPLEERRVSSAPARPVGRYRPGRRCGRQQGRGRGRPGHHVRLCLQRDAGADAGADLSTPTRSSKSSPIARKAKANGAAELGPDAKSQVTVRYENGKPVGVTQIVLSTQHLDES